MKYIGTFKNIKDDQYTVNIITENNPSVTKVITLGNTPFVLKGKSDGLYGTLKLREATITIVNDSFLFDLYSSTAHGTRVEIYDKTNAPVFIGYITPNAYNQGYSSLYEEIEIQAVDGVSTLEYFNYETDNKTIVSFLSIIDKCLAKCNCYTTLTYPKSIRLSSTDTSDFLSKLHISEYNFFDDDEEVTPHKMKDVLDEMLKYLGLTLTVHNNEVLLLDYDYIKTGGTAYWKHTINGSTTTATLANSYTITSESHEDSDSNLSLSDTYNQISININLYEIKDLLPDIFENTINIIGDGMNSANYIKTNINNKYVYFTKLYTNVRFNQFFYSSDGIPLNIDLPSLGKDSIDSIVNDIGCLIAKQDSYKISDGRPSKLGWDDVLIIGMGTNSRTFEDLTKLTLYLQKDYPIMSLNTNSQVDSVISPISNSTAYLLISGEYFQTDSLYTDPSTTPDGYWNNDSGAKVLKLKLQIGNKYWNGGVWSDSDTTFFANVGAYGKAKPWFEWNSINNNVDYTYNIDSEGYAIPIKSSDKLYGKVKLTIYRPFPYGYGEGGRIKRIPKYCLLRNFRLKLFEGMDNSEQSDSDIKYTNVINDNFVNEFSDIELKVNSQTEKGYSFSSVLEKSGNDFVYNTSLYYVPLGKSQLQEYNLIEKMYNHFKDTKKILTMTIENAIKPYSTVKEDNLNTVFVVDTQEIDYAADSSTATLNEV